MRFKKIPKLLTEVVKFNSALDLEIITKAKDKNVGTEEFQDLLYLLKSKFRNPDLVDANKKLIHTALIFHGDVTNNLFIQLLSELPKISISPNKIKMLYEQFEDEKMILPPPKDYAAPVGSYLFQDYFWGQSIEDIKYTMRMVKMFATDEIYQFLDKQELDKWRTLLPTDLVSLLYDENQVILSAGINNFSSQDLTRNKLWMKLGGGEPKNIWTLVEILSAKFGKTDSDHKDPKEENSEQQKKKSEETKKSNDTISMKNAQNMLNQVKPKLSDDEFKSLSTIFQKAFGNGSTSQK